MDIPYGTSSLLDEHQPKRIKSRSVRGVSFPHLETVESARHTTKGAPSTFWGGALLLKFARKGRSDDGDHDGESDETTDCRARAVQLSNAPSQPEPWSAPPLPVRRKSRRRARRQQPSPPPPAGATSPSAGGALVFLPLADSVTPHDTRRGRLQQEREQQQQQQKQQQRHK